MGIELTALHWIYVVFIALIIGFMVRRRDDNSCLCGWNLLFTFVVADWLI